MQFLAVFCVLCGVPVFFSLVLAVQCFVLLDIVVLQPGLSVSWWVPPCVGPSVSMLIGLVLCWSVGLCFGEWCWVLAGWRWFVCSAGANHQGLFVRIDPQWECCMCM